MKPQTPTLNQDGLFIGIECEGRYKCAPTLFVRNYEHIHEILNYASEHDAVQIYLGSGKTKFDNWNMLEQLTQEFDGVVTLEVQKEDIAKCEFINGVHYILNLGSGHSEQISIKFEHNDHCVIYKNEEEAETTFENDMRYKLDKKIK